MEEKSAEIKDLIYKKGGNCGFYMKSENWETYKKSEILSLDWKVASLSVQIPADFDSKHQDEHSNVSHGESVLESNVIVEWCPKWK